LLSTDLSDERVDRELASRTEHGQRLTLHCRRHRRAGGRADKNKVFDVGVDGVIVNLSTHGYTPGLITNVGEALKPLVSA
jgi:hypothetical protein